MASPLPRLRTPGRLVFLPLVALLVSMLATGTAFANGASASVTASGGVSYGTTSGKLAAQSLRLGAQGAPAAPPQQSFAAPNHAGSPQAAPASNAPGATGLPQLKANSPALLHNFNGLSGVDNAKVAGVLVHPPDQGLCVGHDASISGNPEVEFELINLVVAEYNVNGVVQKSALMPSGKESLNNFFNEPGTPFVNGGELVSDPRCVFDKPTNTYFFSVVAACSPAVGCTTALESHMDLIVYNATSGKAKEYKIDDTFPTHLGCPCLGDQPKIGVDNQAIYLSVDEYQDWAAGGTVENGSDVFILSKPQLVAQTTTNFTVFTDLTIGGIPVTSLQPAISTSATSKEFLVNSFPFLADGENNPIAHTLGSWVVTGDSNVTTGNFHAVFISGKIISSETYAFPVLALSSGAGTPRSAAFLQPDDSRLQTCQFVSGDTWCSLSTAVNIKNDPETRDGIAWFELSTSGNIAGQGYVASATNYLIYPAIVHNASGTTGIVFTLTSRSINPSAAYVIRASGQSTFSGIQIAALGVSPSTDGASRWGDYSFATLDPNGRDLWMATEYVPPFSSQNPITNFGTRIFDVA